MVTRRPFDGPVSEQASGGAFKDLVQFAPDAIVVVDAGGIIRHAAPSVTAVLGHRPDAIEGARFDAIVDPDDVGNAQAFLQAIAARVDGTPTTTELRFRRRDDSSIYGEATGANLLANADARGLVITIRDISSRKNLEEQLRFQAFHDALTGLANRALFTDRLERALRVRRGPGEVAPAVAFIDLDDFKVINDTLGHAIGDRVLQVVAERIVTCLRAADTAARLGGDEFVILVEESIQSDHLVDLVQRVIEAIRAPIVIADRTLTIEASAGVATATADVQHGQEMIRRADVAMYRAKAQGKGRVVQFAGDLPASRHDHQARADALAAAIAGGHIRTSFAPAVDLTTGTVVSAETVVEWESPDLGTQDLTSFIDLAAESGLIDALFDAVAATTVAALAAWTAEGTRSSSDRLSPVSAIIALPGEVALHRDFGARVLERCTAAGVDPRRVVFEVHEAALRNEVVIEVLTEWAHLGFGLSVEHFGAGIDSLHLLERIPLRRLKIDEAYVAYLREHRDPALIVSLIKIAEAVGADTVAERVDTFGGAEHLWSLGCVAAEGNAFGGPTTAAGFGQLLAAESDRAWTGFV